MALKIAPMPEQCPKVLVVDDDLDHHKIIGVALNSEFDVRFEASGANAVETALLEKPDFVLLDLQMPHVDGFEVLEQFKHHPLLASMPVFCMSATSDEAIRERCSRLGGSSFISKPINVKTLGHDIQKTLANLSASIVSRDLRASVYIGMNDNDMRSWYQRTVTQVVREQKLLVLSVRDGVFYQDPKIEGLVIDGLVVHLQIKPSLIARLPFLDDLTIVLNDIRDLLEGGCAEYSVIVDRPELLLLSPSIENKTAAILAFADMLRSAFTATHYLCRRPSDSFEQSAVNEMAKLLTRRFAL